MIRAEDFDIPSLEDADFQTINDSEDQNANRHFCFVMADLSLVALDILNLHAPRSKITLINRSAIGNRLAAVALRISPAHDFWSCQLRINYNLVTLIFCRTDKETDSATLCSEASSNILTTFETIVVQGTIRQCYPSSPIALLAAAVQFAQEVRSAIAKGSILKAVSAHSQLEKLHAPVEALSNYWPQLEAVSKLCKSLSTRAETLIKENQLQSQPVLLNSELSFDTGVAWQDVMAGYYTPNLGLGLEVEEWMNSFSWGGTEQ